MFAILCFENNLYLFMAPEGLKKGRFIHIQPSGQRKPELHLITGVGTITFRKHQLSLFTVGPKQPPLPAQTIIELGQPIQAEDTQLAA